MRIDLEHQFVLPILAILAYPVEASRSEMSAPFSKIIKFAMEKLLGSDVHEIAFARLIEAFDYQRAGAFQFQERRTTVKRELRLHRRGAFSGVAKNSARELARLVARQRQIAGIARHLGAGNSSPLHVALVGPDLHCPAANRLAHAGVQNTASELFGTCHSRRSRQLLARANAPDGACHAWGRRVRIMAIMRDRNSCRKLGARHGKAGVAAIGREHYRQSYGPTFPRAACACSPRAPAGRSAICNTTVSACSPLIGLTSIFNRAASSRNCGSS